MRVLWVTNLPAPYRRPVFASLADRANLSVAYLRVRDSYRQWSIDASTSNIREGALRLGSTVAERPDVLVLAGWERPRYLLQLASARLLGIPVVHFYESTMRTHRFKRGPVSALRRLVFRCSDAVLTVGTSSTAAVLAMRFPPERIVQGFNAVDVWAINSAVSMPSEDRMPRHDVLYVGQLIERKNVITALAAWAAERGPEENFTIVGAGELETSLKEAAAALGLRANVRFAGYQVGANLMHLFSQHNTLVLPSTEEVWGLVVNEALAAGLHVVVSEAAGVAADVCHMRGVYVAAPDKKGLRDALRRSRAEWAGRIRAPQILEHTPERLADDALEAIGIASRVRRRHALQRASRSVPDDARLAWLTNIPTPYRAPLWRAVADECHLDVYCLAASEPNRHWTQRIEAGRATVRVLAVPSRQVNDELMLYGPSRRIPGLLTASGAGALVLDGWESPAFMQAVWLARRRGVATVASYRSTVATHRFHGGPVALARRRFFAAVDAVLTAGSASAEAVLALGVDPRRVVTGFNAVDVRGLYEAVAAARALLPKRPGHHVIAVGHVIRRKNLLAGLQAWHSVRNPDDTFTVVGTGPLLDGLRNYVRDHDLEGRVIFTGHLEGDELHRAWAAADTLIMPSTQEVWGLVVNEALAAGLHAVVSDVAGVAGSLDHMRGVYVAAPAVPALAAALARSRDDWTGPIEHPEILQHTPDAAADAVLDAVRVAQEIRDRRLGRT